MKLPSLFPALLCCIPLGCSPAQVKPVDRTAPGGLAGVGGNAPRTGGAGVAGAGGAGGAAAGPGAPVAPGAPAMPAMPPPRPDAGPRDRAPTPDTPPRIGVLYVTGSDDNEDLESDQTLISRLRDLDFRVDVETDTSVTPADLEDTALVLLSASSDSMTVLASLPNAASVPTPILAMDENLEPLLNFTAPADRGTTNQTQVAILAGAEPALTAGLSGTVTVYTAMSGLCWGVPGPGALRVATVNGNENEVAIYAYPKGAMMANNATAPAKRVFYFVRESDTEDLLTEDGLKLFDAAVAYAIAP
jgi:hypothetical protein